MTSDWRAKNFKNLHCQYGRLFESWRVQGQGCLLHTPFFSTLSWTPNIAIGKSKHSTANSVEFDRQELILECHSFAAGCGRVLLRFSNRWPSALPLPPIGVTIPPAIYTWESNNYQVNLIVNLESSLEHSGNLPAPTASLQPRPLWAPRRLKFTARITSFLVNIHPFYWCLSPEPSQIHLLSGCEKWVKIPTNMIVFTVFFWATRWISPLSVVKSATVNFTHHRVSPTISVICQFHPFQGWLSPSLGLIVVPHTAPHISTLLFANSQTSSHQSLQAPISLEPLSLSPTLFLRKYYTSRNPNSGTNNLASAQASWLLCSLSLTVHQANRNALNFWGLTERL